MATKPRSRKRKPAPVAGPVTAPEPTPATESRRGAPASEDPKNLSPLEGTLSVYGGALLLVAGLFPRTFKQFLLLGLGAAFVYRGQSRHCQVYQTLGIDTNKASLLKQLGNSLFS